MPIYKGQQKITKITGLNNAIGTVFYGTTKVYSHDTTIPIYIMDSSVAGAFRYFPRTSGNIIIFSAGISVLNSISGTIGASGSSVNVTCNGSYYSEGNGTFDFAYSDTYTTGDGLLYYRYYHDFQHKLSVSSKHTFRTFAYISPKQQVSDTIAASIEFGVLSSDLSNATVYRYYDGSLHTLSSGSLKPTATLASLTYLYRG